MRGELVGAAAGLGVLSACQGADDLLDRAAVDASPPARIVFESIKAATLDDERRFMARVRPSATFAAKGRPVRLLMRQDLNRFTFCSLRAVTSEAPGTADAKWFCTPADVRSDGRDSIYRFVVRNEQIASVEEVL